MTDFMYHEMFLPASFVFVDRKSLERQSAPFLKATFGKWQFSMPLSRINQKKATAFKMMNFAEITCAKAAIKVALKTAKWRKNT